ncbi:MAG: YjbQ family protein [Rhodospirillaceae bacterium]|nr:YjbQ family protein [Rhodospirillaceae bacterium]
MKQAQHKLTFETQSQGLYEITDHVCGWVASQGIQDGLLTVFCAHTSASLTIQENADQDVQHDIQAFFSRLVSDDPSLYRHTTEGSDDMPAHIKSALTDVSLSIPVAAGKPLLGTWQGIFLFEHRSHPHRRNVILQLMGTTQNSRPGR